MLYVHVPLPLTFDLTCLILCSWLLLSKHLFDVDVLSERTSDEGKPFRDILAGEEKDGRWIARGSKYQRRPNWSSLAVRAIPKTENKKSLQKSHNFDFLSTLNLQVFIRNKP